MIAFKVENGEILLKNNDLIVLDEIEKIKQDICERIKHIERTYDLRKEIGIPWLEYIGNLKEEDRENLIVSYIYSKIQEYSTDISNIAVEIEKSNRESIFNISFDYKKNNLSINIDRRRINE